MIQVGISGFFVIYLLSFLALILTLWIVYESRGRGREIEHLERRIFRCSICTHVYLDDRDEKFSRCPRCGSLNETAGAAGVTGDRRRGRVGRRGGRKRRGDPGRRSGTRRG